MSDTRTVELPLHAPYHAEHMYTYKDIESLLDIQATSTWSLHPRFFPILSSATGQLAQGDNLLQVMRIALLEVFQQPIQFEFVAERLQIERGASEKTRLAHTLKQTTQLLQMDPKTERNVSEKSMVSA